MKYFLVKCPYLAVIKAKNKEKAIELYTENVADNENGEVDENIEEIARDKALILFSRCVDDETGKRLKANEILKSFDTREEDVLLFDKALA